MKKKWGLRHCDLDLWHKVTNFNRVWAIVVSNHLAKTVSKSVHLFGWNLFTSIQTHKRKQTNCNENITPPRIRGSVILFFLLLHHDIELFDCSLRLAFMLGGVTDSFMDVTDGRQQIRPKSILCVNFHSVFWLDDRIRQLDINDCALVNLRKLYNF